MGNEIKNNNDGININNVLERFSEDISHLWTHVEKIENELQDKSHKLNIDAVKNSRYNPLYKDWVFRIIKETESFTKYFPCISYIEDNKINHIRFDVGRVFVRNFIVIASYYSSSDILIEVIERFDDMHSEFRFFTYNEKSHKSEEIEDPRVQAKRIGTLLSCMGYPLPKRYDNKLYGVPFNYKYRGTYFEYETSYKECITECELEENY